MSSVGRKRSEIWNYFTISVSDEKKAVCYECHKDVAHGGDKTNSFNTSNLWKHLKCRHPDKLRELKESEKEASKKKEAAKEQTENTCDQGVGSEAVDGLVDVQTLGLQPH